MPSKNKAGACSCCGECDVTLITEDFSVAHDTTITMESTTYYAWNLPSLTGDQTVYATWDQSGSLTTYYVFQLTGGDWYRVLLPYSTASATCKIEKSTDSGSTWTDHLTYTNATSNEIIEYKNREASDGTVTIPTTDFVGEGIARINPVVYGNNGTDCYFGISAVGLTKTAPSDLTWLQNTLLEIWDTTAGKATLQVGFLAEIASDTIATSYFASTSTNTVTSKYVRLGTFAGYDCTTEKDPNCSTVCPAAYPSVFLNVSSATFTLTHGTVGKATTIASDFSANDGYDWLQDGEIQDNDPLTVQSEITENQGTSKTEWVTNGYSVKYLLENSGYNNAGGGFACRFEGSTTTYSWWAQPSYYYRRGFTGPFDSLGRRQWLNNYTWTVFDDPLPGAPGNKGVSAFAAAINSSYDGDIESDISEKGVSFELSVASETDCAITLELTMTDTQLQHGVSSTISAGSPLFETTPVRTISSVTPTWTFTHGSNWKFPYTARLDPPPSSYVETCSIIPTGSTAGSYGPFLAYHQTNTGGFNPEVTFTTNFVETTPADPSWLPWIVTWQKTINKADLPTTSVVNFSGSDVTSSNIGTGRTTLVPPDYSLPGQHAYNDTYLRPSGNSGAGFNCVSWRPYSYTKSTATVVNADWSASITLDNSPF